MIVKLLTEHHLELLSLKGGCRGWSESTLVKMSNCWNSHVTAHIISINIGKATYNLVYYTQLQNKPIRHFLEKLWKSELRIENTFIPYSVAFSFASHH